MTNLLNMNYTLKAVCLLLFIPALLQAQDFPLNPISFADCKVVSGKWNQAGSLSIHPFKNAISAESGKEITYASGPARLQTKTDHTDLKLEFEFLQSKETEATLNLGNGFEINLNNSSEGKRPFMGSIVGSANAGQNVCKTTGLWQKLELTFITAQNGDPAILQELKINGVFVHQNVLKWGLSGQSAPITFSVSKGTLAFRKLAASSYGKKNPVSIGNITYTLHETSSWQTEFAFTEKPAINGTSDVLTARIPNDFRHFNLVSKGDLNVEEEGTYAFTLDYQGKGKLLIDGNQVAGSDEVIFRTPNTGLIDLTKGKHSFEYSYNRIWWPAGLGLFVSGPNFRPYALHDASSLPDPQISGGVLVEPDGNKASLIRSFMEFGQKKRTEVISVGSPLQRHFSFDLENACPLFGWKGNFADVTEMWYQRGEPQILQTLGQTISFSGKKAFKIEGIDGNLKLEEYYLDKEGLPTFNHLLDGQLVSQKLIPTHSGITVEVGSASEKALYLIGSATSIESLGDGLYRTETYYLKIPASVKVTSNVVDGQTELWAAANKLQSFEIIW